MQGMQPNASDVDVDLARLWTALIANWKRILIVAVLAAMAGLAFAMLATPKYKAATRVLIEMRESIFTRAGTGVDSERPVLDEEGVTSQVELISSSDILRAVVRQLDLTNVDEFARRRSSLGELLVLLGLRSDPSAVSVEERIINELREDLLVYRVERSRVIVIEFSSPRPELAAAVPNAIADAYLDVQREAKLLSNADATEWLEPEINDLRARVREAEAKVAEFRSSSGLLVGQNNSMLATQQLSELSSELSRVRAERSSAVAKAAEVRAAIESGRPVEAMPEVLSSALVQRLVERRVQLNSEIADLSTTLLENHPRIRSLRSQLVDLDRQIREEVVKVLSALESEGASAQRRELELTAELDRLKAASARAGEEEVELRALEREATAQRELLESYLTRYREASSRFERNYLPVDARVFARATPPVEPYFPKPVPIVGAAFAGALLLMAIAILLRELFSGRALQAATGRGFERVEDVVMVPGPVHSGPSALVERGASTTPNAEPVAAPSVALSDVPAPDDDSGPVYAGLDSDAAGELTVEAAAERLISEGASRAIFVSPEGDEAVAASVMVAREVSDAGLRVVFLDLTQSAVASNAMLESNVYAGITDLLCSRAQFSDVIHADLYSECHIIPVGNADITHAMRAIDRLPIIMNSLSTAYDLVVVECGPANPEGVKRVVDDSSILFVGTIEPDHESVVEASRELAQSGFHDVFLVSPGGDAPPPMPRGRRAA